MATHSFRLTSPTTSPSPFPTPATQRSPHKTRRALMAAGFAVTGTLGLLAVPASAQLGGAKSTDIGLKNLKFTPSKATVAKGAKVNFIWKEKVAHNIVVDSTHKSPTQNKGVWTTTFTKTGTYKYKCTLHPGMNGEITVK